MADEIRLRAALSFAKSGRSASGDTGELSATMAGTKGLETGQTVGTTEEALVLGEVPAANAYYWIRNLDATNPLHIKPSSGAAVCTQVSAGMVAVGQFGPGVNAPFVQAVGAPVEIAIVLVQV